ncbi:hypothetical protein, partial [Neobacillus drentensis]|uniref:hypothetical protein n=1 Tax=Neobacillus drentensis TaxID=220684 RepID=UPI003001F01C
SSSGDKDDSKKDKKSKSGSKESSNSSEKKQKNTTSKDKSAMKKEEAIKEVIVEPNNTLVWAQPIKIESKMVQTKDEFASNNLRIKKSQTEEKDLAKNSTDMKKSEEDIS